MSGRAPKNPVRVCVLVKSGLGEAYKKGKLTAFKQDGRDVLEFKELLLRSGHVSEMRLPLFVGVDFGVDDFSVSDGAKVQYCITAIEVS